ncbi:MAG: extracellular solute-binding protein [Oscillospiraceae bacterium]|nr:extracellular solute-binding protein [Oscillospiraceae bacterium]
MTQTWKKIATASLAAVMITGALAGCGGSETASIDPENPVITIQTKSFNADSAADDSQVVQALNEYLGATLKFTWVPSTSYDEKVTTAMAAGEYPTVMLIGTRSASVIQASKDGAFWDLTEYLKDSDKYPNLAQTSELVNHNISIDGHVYGIYRTRELGRAGVTIRKDWLDNLGLDIPTTIEEFSNVLRAFTEDDPDGNGVDDTYGMIVTDYLDGPLNNLAIWMGAPNGWGLDENGELKPAFMFDEWKETLNLMKSWYDAGYINSDMATYSSDKWNEQFLTGQAGVIIDVADRARRVAANIAELNPSAVVDVFGYVTKDADTEPRTLPTTGYDGYFVIPKASVTTEEDLDLVLTILDKANDATAENYMNYGIEGIHYTLDEEGYAVKTEDEALLKEVNDLNQFAMGIVDSDDKLSTKYTVEVAEKIEQVYEENRNWAVSNPVEPYISDTYSTKGPQLDAIMAEANTKYIVGQITEEEWDAQVERWLSQGGQGVIDDYNEAYAADDSVN